MTATTVMVLNASYEPFQKVDFPHAMRMLARKVAELVEGDEAKMAGPWPWPKVIRLVRYVTEKWLDRPAHWHRGEVLIRDRHRCGYQ